MTSTTVDNLLPRGGSDRSRPSAECPQVANGHASTGLRCREGAVHRFLLWEKNRRSAGLVAHFRAEALAWDEMRRRPPGGCAIRAAPVVPSLPAPRRCARAWRSAVKENRREQADLPAEQPQARQAPRLPAPDGDPGGPRGAAGPPPAGPSPPVGLIWRIRDRSTFAELRRRGRRIRRGPLSVTWLAEEVGRPPRVAYAVGRPVGTAVARNRLRRRLRGARCVADQRRSGRRRPDLRGTESERGRSLERLDERAGPVTRVLLALIAMYQRLRAGRPSPCRFTPSCSEYAADAVVEHGPLRGSWLTARRLGRCQPWGGHGWDPVPPARTRSVRGV
jgi:uncharacterized protein